MKQHRISPLALLSVAAVILLVVFVLWQGMKPAAPASTEDASTSSALQTLEKQDTARVSCNGGLFDGLSVYPSGGYVGGEDLAAGTYVAVIDPTAIDADAVEVNVFTTSTANVGSMTIDLLFPSYGYFEVKDGQYVSIDGGVFLPLDEAPTINDATKPNLYLVGRDLAAGLYLIEGESGHFELYRNGIRHIDIYDSRIYQNRAFVQVQEGDYLHFTGDLLVPEAAFDDHLLPSGDLLDSGSYRVGEELAPGSYTVQPTAETAFLDIAQGVPGTAEARQYERLSTDEPTEITVTAGEVLTLHQAKINRKPNQ